MDRAKLDTVIEREVHRLVRDIREHTYDFTHLYLRRNGIEVDRGQLEKILEVVKVAIDDGEGSKIGMFHERLKKSLDDFAGEENPTQPTEVPLAASPQQSQPAPKKVTFQL